MIVTGEVGMSFAIEENSPEDHAQRIAQILEIEAEHAYNEELAGILYDFQQRLIEWAGRDEK